MKGNNWNCTDNVSIIIMFNIFIENERWNESKNPVIVTAIDFLDSKMLL